MSFLDNMTQQLIGYAEVVPVELYTFGASFIEELIAPIPSPIVMTVAGSIAAAQNTGWLMLFWLAVLGAVGKIIGAAILYFFADKAENIFSGKFGKLIGISHNEIEAWGKFFGKGKKDIVVMFFARAIPIIPTGAVSLLAGFIKMNFANFAVASVLGYIVRNVIYLYIGYIGAETLVTGLDDVESLVQLGLAGVLGLLVTYIYFQRRKKGGAALLERFNKPTVEE